MMKNKKKKEGKNFSGVSRNRAEICILKKTRNEKKENKFRKYRVTYRSSISTLRKKKKI